MIGVSSDWQTRAAFTHSKQGHKCVAFVNVYVRVTLLLYTKILQRYIASTTVRQLALLAHLFALPVFRPFAFIGPCVEWSKRVRRSRIGQVSLKFLMRYFLTFVFNAAFRFKMFIVKRMVVTHWSTGVLCFLLLWTYYMWNISSNMFPPSLNTSPKHFNWGGVEERDKDIKNIVLETDEMLS